MRHWPNIVIIHIQRSVRPIKHSLEISSALRSALSCHGHKRELTCCLSSVDCRTPLRSGVYPSRSAIRSRMIGRNLSAVSCMCSDPQDRDWRGFHDSPACRRAISQLIMLAQRRLFLFASYLMKLLPPKLDCQMKSTSRPCHTKLYEPK